MLTASAIFLEALYTAGITHVFVNWGSDHPGLLEELERQRIIDGKTALNVITAPNEMVALSAAQGYAQSTGQPAAVIVHVDVGTQSLGGAVHNVDRSRTPVVIYAGASPFSLSGELRGSRNEWIMWPQDIPDQAAIVRQYMRFTGHIQSPRTVYDTVNRAVQISTSDPKGPVYLWGRREVMEAELPKSALIRKPIAQWPPVDESALSPVALSRMGTALLTATNPLIITSYLGRNWDAVGPLVVLSTLLAVPVYCTCPSVVNVPFSHPYFVGLSYLTPGTQSELLGAADVVLVIECDTPWIPARPNISSEARVFVINSGDPLNASSMGLWHVPAEMVCRADAELALVQLASAIRALDVEGMQVTGSSVLSGGAVQGRQASLKENHEQYIRALDDRETLFDQAFLRTANVVGTLRRVLRVQGIKPVVLNEAISKYGEVWESIRPVLPGSMLTSGGSSLGWGLGAAVGACLAEKERVGVLKKVALAKEDDDEDGSTVIEAEKLVVSIVGDGSFVFGVPTAAYWMARQCDAPFLTIILNNGGWKSPTLSMLGVRPGGLGHETKLASFGPHTADYAGIAVAATAGWAWGRKVDVWDCVQRARLEEDIPSPISPVVKLSADDMDVSKNGNGDGDGSEAKQDTDKPGTAMEIAKGLQAIVKDAVDVVVKERRCAVLDCVLEGA
ncbi:Thiamin diphosphate-binding protein [Cylindrobasidium torrendii FP15055 ss-10]|uniref:Thiamin diphosphate-binding protein n=1 Tax=Cylindrobasidium torrendii FP15055 ss-10 TaxID=1314674 RepID=A0A0D7AXA4_9AGAR|nr:Thiamin diphosphate-binding protein [Cylindrobasidium torrendii FP15055 ss-10]